MQINESIHSDDYTMDISDSQLPSMNRIMSLNDTDYYQQNKYNNYSDLQQRGISRWVFKYSQIKELKLTRKQSKKDLLKPKNFFIEDLTYKMSIKNKKIFKNKNFLSQKKFREERQQYSLTLNKINFRSLKIN